MRGSSLVSISLGTFAAALVACGAALFLSFDIAARVGSHQIQVMAAQAENAAVQNKQNLHNLAPSTADNTANLNSLLNVDVLGIASDIEDAGKASGAATVIGAASSQSVKVSGATDLHTLEFIVTASGTFSQVMRAAQLFESLPLASTIEELDFSHQSSGTPAWQLSARIKVLTTADISS